MRSLFTIISHFFRSLFSRENLPEDTCLTRYPIILIHGIAYRDDMAVSAWGSIPDFIRKKGGRVFLSEVEAWATYQRNAGILADKIDEVLKQTGAEKVNLIAHSKGGIDARYAITKLNLANKVASLTTICTPHRGAVPADIVVGLLPDEDNVAYKLANLLAHLMGDKNPDSSLAVQQLTRKSMGEFNQEIQNNDNVYYQSYGCEMLNPLNDLLFSITYEIIKKYEGANDGMVSSTSCRWGVFQGIEKGKLPGIGISHLQMTGSVFPIVSNVDLSLLYAKWVNDLKKKGF